MLVYRNKRKMQKLNGSIHAIVLLLIILLDYVIVKRESRHNTFNHGQCYVSLPHINRSYVLQSMFLFVSQNRFTRTSTPEGPRRSAFCFRKAIDSVEDHYTLRVYVSSTTSFHPVNAYVGQCFPFGVQGRRQPKFLLQHLLAEQFNFVDVKFC